MLKVLLDTEIVIYHETGRKTRANIGNLYSYIDKLHYVKCIHPVILHAIQNLRDVRITNEVIPKLKNYLLLEESDIIHTRITTMFPVVDKLTNDGIIMMLLNGILQKKFDVFISEDKEVHKRAADFGLSDRVYRIDDFLNKIIDKNPELINYNILSIKKELFRNLNFEDAFFDSLRETYVDFEKWFKIKANENAYVCYNDGAISAFLYLKLETEIEDYSGFCPVFLPKRRLKIGTFKISLGIKLSERFLFIIFDNARKLRVDEIYVTVFDEELGPALLVKFLEDWGFQYFGTKTSVSGTEKVYVKSFREIDYNDFINPRLCYPFFSGTSNLFIVPIYQQYHTELFPDSILKTESPADFVENMPHRNAISKVYISRSLEHKLKCGDLIIFYRTGDPGRGYYTGVVTTLGIVESVEVNIKDESTFVQICSKRSVFPEEKLREQWNYGRSRPFVVNFLYVYSFPKRPNLKWLHENGIIPDINDMPRGFRKIPRIALKKIFEYQP